MFSLVTAYPTTNGMISGSWVQGCCRGLTEAIDRCKATSKLNSNMPMAIIPEMSNSGIGEWAHNVKPLFLVGTPEKLQEHAEMYRHAFGYMAVVK